ncbi:hypothetical protein DPMN_044483 [Dreissena polymorpha]|uniref:Uncharacterized protein n=1 Tax=Dreissena polymorpha TaxID=45954 RepID=A0A9D4D4I3_DREPO|nr:hypothetical protein DPMN_044483 [Dreissena polymorpha]
MKNAPPPVGHVFGPTYKISLGHNYLLTKFHHDWTINVASRVLTWKNAPHTAGTIFVPVQDIIGTKLLTKKNAPPLGSHVFHATRTIFELTRFHDDCTINVTSRVITRKNVPPPCGHFFNQLASFLNSSKILFG